MRRGKNRYFEFATCNKAEENEMKRGGLGSWALGLGTAEREVDRRVRDLLVIPWVKGDASLAKSRGRIRDLENLFAV